MNAVLGAALGCGLVLGLVRVEADEDVLFHPCRHTPPGDLARVSVRSVASLRESLRTSGFSCLLESSFWTDASRSDPDASSDGSGLLHLLPVVQGALVLDVDAPRVPSESRDRSGQEALPWTLAVELCGARQEILEVVAGVTRRLEKRTGLKSKSRAIDGTNVEIWTHPAARFCHAQTAQYLILASSAVRVEAAIRAGVAPARDGVEARLSRGATTVTAAGPWRAPDPLCLERPEVLARVRLPRLIDWLLANSAATSRRDLSVILKAVGIDVLESFWFALGRLDGGVETAWLVTSSGGARGLVEVIQRACGRLTEVGRVLHAVPAGATRIQAVRLRTGSFLRGLDRYARRNTPEIGRHLDAAYREVESFSGISVRQDLFELGGVSPYLFSIPAPADGTEREHIVLLRTEELRPYWRILEKAVALCGGSWVAIPPRAEAEDQDAVVRYVHLGVVGQRESAGKSTASGSSVPAAWGRAAIARLLPVVARLDRADGWTALSVSPMSLLRYRDSYSHGEMLNDRRTTATRVLEVLEGATAGVVLRASEVSVYPETEVLRAVAHAAPPAIRAGAPSGRPSPASSVVDPERLVGVSLRWSAAGLIVRTRRLPPSTIAMAFVAASVALGWSDVRP